MEEYWDYSLQTLLGQSDGICDVAFSSDDNRLLFSFSSGSVEIWDAGTGVLRDTLPHGRKNTIGYSLQNGILFYEIVDQTVIVQDLQGGIHHTVAGTGSDLQYLCISPNCQLLATVHGDQFEFDPDIYNIYTVRFWDLATGLPRGTLKGELIGYPRIDFSQDGRLIALISKRGGVKLCGQMESWEIHKGDTIARIYSRTHETWAYASSPDRQFSVKICTSNVEFWDPQTGLRDDRFPHEARIYAFSPDGRFVALTSSSRVEVHCKQMESVDYYEAQISPDGQWLVDLPDFAGDGKNITQVIQLWDTATGELSDRLELSTETGIESMTFSPDSHLLAADNGNQIFLWDLNTHSLSCTLITHGDISCVTLSSPEARLLACGSYTSTVFVYLLNYFITNY